MKSTLPEPIVISPLELLKLTAVDTIDLTETHKNETMKITLDLTLNQFEELKYLVDLELDKDSNLVKFNEDEELIASLLDLRQKLKQPIVTN